MAAKKILVCTLLSLILASVPAAAELLLNDGWNSGAAAGFQSGFVAGEIGAVRLVPATSGAWPLQNVQLLFGGATTTEAITLHIWEDTAGTLGPGPEIYTRDYQITGANNALNEIDLSGAGVMVSGAIRIGIEFTHSGTPSIARDGDGTIAVAQNFIFSGGTWYQSNTLGLAGDWIIRANIDTAVSTYTVGGTVTGLNGSLTLQNNGGDDLVIATDGPFTFATALGTGASYNVTVTGAPAGQVCTVTNGTGTIAGADIIDVVVECTDLPAGSTTVANDGFSPGDTAGFQGGFVAGEIAASRLTTPDATSWSVETVEFLFGGATTQQTVTLKIWDDNGGTLVPGTEIYSGDFLVTGGDALQQIDLTAAGVTVSGDFRVGLQVQHAGLPSVARDDDGNIMADRNFIFTSTAAWFESGSLGLTGDWIIRATVSPGPPPPPFALVSIVDFPNDQGRQVRLTWAGAAGDAPGSATPVTGYALFRRIDPDLKAYPPGDWDYLATVPAFQEASYATIVATAADSSIVAGMYYSTFFVRAMTADPGVYFDSAPDSGYSVDNLVPQTPQGFAVAYDGVSGNSLTWAESADADFAYFKVYRGFTPDFVADPANPVHTTIGSAWTDPGGDWDDYYRVSAVDVSGNESPLTAGEDTAVSGVAGSDLPQVAALYPVYPNPFNPSTTISFAIPEAGAVRLAVYDIGGRLVRTLLHENRSAGRHDVVWDGRDDNGRLLSSGVFFARFDQGTYTGRQRMTLLK